uniref:Uncharacterized protein n=1 Tax=Glossina pallidipes TaxID=7398 RepID=A0A1B0A1S4_GLOPL
MKCSGNSNSKVDLLYRGNFEVQLQSVEQEVEGHETTQLNTRRALGQKQKRANLALHAPNLPHGNDRRQLPSTASKLRISPIKNSAIVLLNQTNKNINEVHRAIDLPSTAVSITRSAIALEVATHLSPATFMPASDGAGLSFTSCGVPMVPTFVCICHGKKNITRPSDVEGSRCYVVILIRFVVAYTRPDTEY